MVLAMTVIVASLLTAADSELSFEFFVMVLSMMVMVTPLLLIPPKPEFPETVLSVSVKVLSLTMPYLVFPDTVLSVSVTVPWLKMPYSPFSIVRLVRVTPVTDASTVTTGLSCAVPSRTAGEPAGPPGHVVMVTGDEMTGWSSIVPET
jgi:hypothetical protein